MSHNNSSVFLTATTYVRRSGRIINGTRSGRTTPQESALQFQTPVHTHTRNDPPKKRLGPTQPPPHRCRSFPLLLVQMGYGLLCGLWRRTNRRPCRPPLSNSSTPRGLHGLTVLDDETMRQQAQHLPRYLGGLAVDKRTRSNERRRSLVTFKHFYLYATKAQRNLFELLQMIKHKKNFQVCAKVAIIF